MEQAAKRSSELLAHYLEGIARAVRYPLLAYIARTDGAQAQELAYQMGLTAAMAEKPEAMDGTILWQRYQSELEALAEGRDGFVPTWHYLSEIYELNLFEAFVLALALAIEVDGACESIYHVLFKELTLSAALRLYAVAPAEALIWRGEWRQHRRKLSALFVSASVEDVSANNAPLALSPAAQRWLNGEVALPSRPSPPVHFSWGDIVLPPKQLAQLRHICNQVRHRGTVYDDWGFGSKLAYGRGVRALFSGPPGTGKTMAAQIIASELERELYKVNIASLVSKYIGDTEKNLDSVFVSAAERDCVLFFDEADAIFGKRGEQRDSHDKYANMQTSYLLQRLEEHDGIVILASNYAGNMDTAFMRRIQNIVEFSKPSLEQRQRIWESLLLPTAPWGKVDIAYLAGFDLTGSEIKSIILQAAFLAVAQNGEIGMNEIVLALNQELHKTGRPKAAKTFGEYAKLLEDNGPMLQIRLESH
jgi:hypothetical protein